MADVNRFHSTWTPRILSLLRIVAAFIFMQHGAQKLFGFPAPLPGGVRPSFTSMVGISGVLEFVGGLLILFGLFTRPAAFILAGEMAVAYFMFHAPGGFWTLLNRGEPAVLYCFIFLYLAVAGPGPWSLDAVLRHDRR